LSPPFFCDDIIVLTGLDHARPTVATHVPDKPYRFVAESTNRLEVGGNPVSAPRAEFEAVVVVVPLADSMIPMNNVFERELTEDLKMAHAYVGIAHHGPPVWTRRYVAMSGIDT